MRKSSTVTRVLLAGAAMTAIASPSLAQTALADTDAAAENEIIVTAQNRTQSVNDVPIVIDVVNNETLKRVGFSDLNDIDKIAPVVQLNQDQGVVKITVRGIGTTSNDETQDTSVVVNIDGEYINRPNALSVALFDMDRVEVLRGPQGTLYGRNSTAGAINFITRKPGTDFGVDATASYGNYNAIRADGGIDLPLGDKAGVRVAGFYEDRDGYVSHPPSGGFFVFPLNPATRSDDNNAYGGRVSLRFDPSDALSINLAGEYARRRFTPGVFAAGDLNAAGNGPTGGTCNNGFTRVAPAYPQLLCVPSNTNLLSAVDRSTYSQPFYGVGRTIEDTWAVRGRIAYKFSDAATLSYIGGYRKFEGDPSNHLTLPSIYQGYNFQGDADTQSHELRLNGTIGGVIYQVGGFYFKEKVASEVGFLIPSFIFGRPPFPIEPGTFVSYFARYVNSDSKSVFGQVEVPLGDTLTAVGGLRYTDNKRSAVYYNSNFPFIASGPARQTIAAPKFSRLDLGSSEDKITWLLGLNYKPNRDTLVYAKASTGFKGGGFDAIGTYRPELNTAYEAGWKQTFGPSRQHQFNLSAFYYDYRDLQVNVLLNTTLGSQTFNAGKATIYGLEADTAIALDRNTHFNASFNYLHARYDQLFAQFNVYTVPGTGPDLNGIGDLDPATPGVQQPNFAGNRPPFSPKFIIAVGLDHVFDLGGAGTITARADTAFKSAYFTDFYNYRDGRQSAYSQTGLSLEYKPANEHFSVQAFVRNLEKVRPLTYGSFVSAGPDDVFNWQFGTPRTYGVRVGVNF